jgi:dihydroorotate dehydrogenase electron transfer subunit
LNGFTHAPQRGTIELEDARVVGQTHHSGNQYILTVAAPAVARRATPGSFAHVRCDADIPMRRPLSIMRANPASGELQFLYKIVGQGLNALSRLRPGDSLSVLGPIGNGFSLNPDKPHKLLVGGGVGIPPMVFLGEQLAAAGQAANTLILMGSEVPFPFPTSRSARPVRGMPDTATHGIDELEQLGIATRLASLADYAGVYRGYVTELAAGWLSGMTPAELAAVEMFGCGPEPMLAAAAKVAAAFGIDCQLSLEEYMACAVGGCAGCTVPVRVDGTIAMKRVCVDGPVFAAHTVYPG